MKNKIMGILVALCMAASTISLATGCGEKPHTDKLVLALRSGTYAEVIKGCLPNFENTYGIDCEVVELSEDDLHSYVLSDSVNRNGSYDLCMVDGSWVSEYIFENVLADLGELGYSFDDDIIPATTSICVQNDKTYLVPYYGNVTVMMYNKEVAKSLGFDESSFKTLEDVKDFCVKSEASGHGGFVYRGDTENNIVVDFLPILCAFGGWVVDENNNPTVNTPEFKKALEFYMEISATGGALSKEDLISAVEEGEMVTAVGWPGWYNSSDSKGADYIAFPGKASGDSESYNSNIYGIWTLGIPSNSTNKEMACKLLTYLMDRDVQKETVSVGGVPCRYSSLNDPEIVEADPHMAVICEALENGIYRPVMQEWPRFYTILGNQMKSIMSGETGISDGLTLAQDELVALMNKK